MSEIRVTSIVGENGGDRVGLTTGLTVGPLTGTTGIGATITHHGHAQFAGVCTATSFVGSGANLTGLANGYGVFDAQHGSSAQSVPVTTWTKIELKSEVADLDSLFDHSSTYRYTPQVAGWYYVAFHFIVTGMGGNSHEMYAAIYKNGSVYANTRASTDSNNDQGCLMNAVVDMNGSSDYLESWGYVDDSDSGGSSPRISGNSSAQYSLFGAYRIIE